ncbi:MAG: CehA/McbA family metallohydrolase [Candidatus Edwardsbacteria bacterium]|nr:CehA/McbA family metallohydrolase [Candidatus Edwardsbacteria bacterium]
MRMTFRILFLCLLMIRAGASQAEYRCFYGNLHAHTSYSDGESTPDTAYAYARDVARVDVQALTEHNNGGSFGGVSYSITPEHYQNLRLIADTITAPGRFVALSGQEVGSIGSSGFGHINIWEAPGLWPYNNSDLLGCYSWILEQGHPAMYCHPDSSWNSNFNDLYYYQDYDRAMDLIEVINSSTLYEDAYFRALEKGWHVGASSNQDNHRRDWGNRVNSYGNIPLTGIWADTLTKAAVLEALQARRTTAMEVSPADDRIELLLSVDGRYQGQHFIRQEGTAKIRIEARASTSFASLLLYSNGIPSDTFNLIPASNQTVWELDKSIGLGTVYYFVKALQTDGDRAWTSPIHIDGVSEKSPVVTWPTPIRNFARIVFTPLSGATSVKAVIFDLSGQKIREITGSQPDLPIGWDGKDARGRQVMNGVYFIRLEQRSATETRTSLGKTMVSR